MKKLFIIAFLFFGSMSFYACDSNKNEGASTDGSTTPVAGDTVELAKDKKKLIPEAAKASMMQIELGKLAIEKGRTDAVKEYGQFMVENYSSKKQELLDYAQSEGVELPQTLDDKQQKQVEKLRDTKPEEFDLAYWDATIRAHKEAIDEFDEVLNLRKERKGKGVDANSFELWAINTKKEKHAQRANAMSYRLAQKNR